MNTKHTHQIRTATLATVVAIVACASTASPAFAKHRHGGGGSGTSSISPYAVPIAALDGMTLAEYIQRHHAGDPRTHTVV